MAKKVLYTDFTDTETIIASMLKSPEMEKAMKRKNLFDMWKKVAGENFAKKSKPYSMMGRTLVIACENPAVAQELLLQKIQIKQKMEPYLAGLKLKVNDIKFDSKKWEKE